MARELGTPLVLVARELGTPLVLNGALAILGIATLVLKIVRLVGAVAALL